MTPPAVRCDLCGRFRKQSCAMGTGNEYEDWVACTDCMSPAELDQHAKAKESPDA